MGDSAPRGRNLGLGKRKSRRESLCTEERLRLDPKTAVKVRGPRGGPPAPRPLPLPRAAPPPPHWPRPAPQPPPPPASQSPPRGAGGGAATPSSSLPQLRASHTSPHSAHSRLPPFKLQAGGGRARSLGSSPSPGPGRLVPQVSAGPAARPGRVLRSLLSLGLAPSRPGPPGSCRARSDMPLSCPLAPRLPDPSPASLPRPSPRPARFPSSLPLAVDSLLQE